MKSFIDFILSDKLYMGIAALVAFLVVVLIILFIKLAKECSSAKGKKVQPYVKNSRENNYNQQRIQDQNVSNEQSKFAERPNISRVEQKPESIINSREAFNHIIEQAPVARPVVKQEIPKDVMETELLNVEVPMNTVDETVLLVTPKPKILAILNYRDGEEAKEYEIINQIINMGRDPEVCDMVISHDNNLSRKHALIYLKNDKFYLTDLNSKNGTYVNGEILQGERQINDGDEIKLGTTEIKFKKI